MAGPYAKFTLISGKELFFPKGFHALVEARLYEAFDTHLFSLEDTREQIIAPKVLICANGEVYTEQEYRIPVRNIESSCLVRNDEFQRLTKNRPSHYGFPEL